MTTLSATTGTALLRCGSAAHAADVVQEVFMGLLTERFAFAKPRSGAKAQ